MKYINKILSALLAVVMLLGCGVFVVTAGDTEVYPELVITEMGVDQSGSASNDKNLNKAYTDTTDPYEFIEIHNNSDKSVNIYDYMLAYQGASSENAKYFECSIQEYTPFFPGADWLDADYTTCDTYWKNTADKRPVNPAHADGAIAPNETFVVWVYTGASHMLHSTFADFRAFWSVDSSVKVFIIDGNDAGNVMNFSLKNDTTGSYLIMRASERFPKRRSADKTYDCEMTNTHHNYEGKNYQTLDEVINWSVVDFRSEPLASFAAASGYTANYTISYMPYTSQTKYENGFKATSFGSLKRSYIEKINTYAEATVGKLNAAQTEAFKKTVTTTVTPASSQPLKLVNNNARPDILITEISADQYGGAATNINVKYKSSLNSDPFECFELYNNSTVPQNAFDLMIGYQGSGSTSVSTYFERSVQEYTPIVPGADWIDAPFTAYDSYWTGSTVTRPVNPQYEDGIIAPGEVFVVWCYMSDSHKLNATIEEFRAFWSIPENVKVFLLDGCSERDRNFNIKNSATGEYIVMRKSERFPERRSDDETYYVEADRSDYYYYDTNFSGMEDIVSWAVVDYGNYDPLYTFRANNGEGSSKTNYTMCYSPYNGEEVFTNGFLTMSFASQKRAHLTDVTIKAHIGVLSAEQKAAIEKAAAASK